MPLLLEPVKVLPPLLNFPLSVPRKAVLLHADARSIVNATDAGKAKNAMCDFMWNDLTTRREHIETGRAEAESREASR
jgi:hypothetical protein